MSEPDLKWEWETEQVDAVTTEVHHVSEAARVYYASFQYEGDAKLFIAAKKAQEAKP